MTIDYDKRVFRSVSNTGTGDVSGATIFRYRQEENVVWAQYSGGGIVRGSLLAIVEPDGKLDMRYQHINDDGDLKTGICRSEPEMLSDGRIRLHEKWRWTCEDESEGESVIEELV